MTSAVLSRCGLYRYRLTRAVQPAAPGNFKHLWVMLNPSTADAEQDDPTIRRVLGFSRTHQADVVEVVNLYALRATDPATVFQVSPRMAVGPENDSHLLEAFIAHRDHLIVVAWGSHARIERVAHVAAMMRVAGVRPVCLGTNKNGSPKHPLYIDSRELFRPWGLP